MRNPSDYETINLTLIQAWGLWEISTPYNLKHHILQRVKRQTPFPSINAWKRENEALDQEIEKLKKQIATQEVQTEKKRSLYEKQLNAYNEGKAKESALKLDLEQKQEQFRLNVRQHRATIGQWRWMLLLRLKIPAQQCGAFILKVNAYLDHW